MKLLTYPCLLVQFGLLAAGVHGQDLLNVDFGENSKVGFAATGRTAGDRWNGFTFPSQQTATVSNLMEAGGSSTPVSLTLENGGGYWGNTTGDAMYDGYVYPNSGLGDGIGNLTVTISNLVAGEYDLYLYGHSDPFGRGECDTMFSASSGANSYGPLGTTLSAGWTATQAWEEGKQYVLFRRVQVLSGQSLVIVGEPGYDGQPSTGPDHPPILNGIQIQKSVAPFGNGSFESPAMAAGFGQALPDGSTAIAGWTIAGSGIGWQNGESFGVNPSDGLQHIGFNGGNEAPGASIFQTFTTTAGQAYRVNFDLGRVGPGSGTVGLLATVTSATGVVLGSLSATAPDSPGYSQARSFMFTATGSRSTLKFLDTSTSTFSVDPLLDNVSVTSSPACVTAPSDLVGWWPGNGNANDVVGANNGGVTGGISFVSGEAGQAFDFNGINSQISLGSTVGNFETNDFTVEFWIRTTATRHESLIEKRPICGYASQWEIRIGSIAPWSGPGRLEAATISDSAGNDLNAISAGRAINDGLFHHVALVRMGTNLVFYIDGVLDVATNVLSGSVSRINNAADVTVGNGACVGVDGTSPFTGQLDEISIYHRALSETEIQTIYNAGSSGKCLPPPLPARALAHWRFDENGGTVAHDSAGTYDGTLSPLGSEFVIDGISGGAMSLSKANNGFVNMGDVLGLTSGDFSLVAWVKTPAGDTTECSDILTKHDAFWANGYLLEVNACGTYAQAGKAWFYDSDNVGQELVGTTTVNDGTWHQVVAVYQAGGNKYVYVDGAPAESSKASLAIVPNNRSFLIGGVSIGAIPTGRFTGLIDEVQVYNYALASSEVEFLYENPGQEVPPHELPPPPPPARPLAHWRFDEGSGTVAHDSAGTHVGTLSSSGSGYVINGISGGALSVSKSNNGFVNMGNVLGLTDGDFSFVAWIKMTAGDTTDSSVVLSKATGGTRNGYFLNVNMTGSLLRNNKAAFIEGGTGVGQITIAETPISTTSVNDGNWHQIVAVYSAEGSKLIYVDGAPAEDSKPSQPFNGNSAPFLIGGFTFGDTPVGFFTGLIDDVQVYNYALSGTDVDFLYQNPGQEVPAHQLPPGEWRLETLAGAGGAIVRDPDLPRYTSGVTVTLTAVPGAGFAFAGWSGDAGGTTNPLTVTMNGNKTIIASFRDGTAPVVVITTPVGGTNTDERFQLTGTITDNQGVASAGWDWNGQSMGSLSLSSNQFSVGSLELKRGENRIRVTATDVDGNAGTTEVVVTWAPERVLALVSPGPVQEGLLLSVPVQLTSGGEVGGMSFVMRYDTNYVSDPELVWSAVVGSALNQVNYDVPGEVRGTFALPATAVPGGVQTIATVGMRARSVPFSLTTDLGLEIRDVSRPTGDAIAGGSDSRSGSAPILVRRVMGDNNANDSLDVGDATIIQRFTAGLDVARSWDVTGNDLNGNLILDSGDVIKVMRVVVGLDGQPQPQGVTPGHRTISKAGPRKAGGVSGSVGLSLDKTQAPAGELVTLQVRLAGLSEPLAGASFTVDYPTNALRLLNAASCRVGPLTPGTAVALWNVAPGQNDFPGQTGRVKFGASSANAWPGTNGLLAELVFEVQGSQTGRYLWPIRVSEVATADGYDPVELADTQINFIGRTQVPVPPTFGSSAAYSARGLEMTLSGEPGVLYEIEISRDLTNWVLLTTATSDSGTVTIVDPDAANHARRFYRAKAQ